MIFHSEKCILFALPVHTTHSILDPIFKKKSVVYSRSIYGSFNFMQFCIIQNSVLKIQFSYVFILCVEINFQNYLETLHSIAGYKTDHRAVLAFTDQCTSGGTGPYILGRPVRMLTIYIPFERGCQYLSNDTWIINLTP